MAAPSSHAPKLQTGHATRRLITVLVAVSATLALLILPASSSAQARAATAASPPPPAPALTGEPFAASATGGYLFGSAPAVSSNDPLPTPASTGPPPPPTKTGTPLPCAPEWCQKLIEHFCHRFDCSLLASQFRGTASNNDKKYRNELRDADDAAFQPPFNGVGFIAHHIVPQGEKRGGIANFAQAMLKHAEIGADDPHNLAGLRGSELQVGTPGYEKLVQTEAGRVLARRMAHVDTTFRFYVQKVNERFAQWVRQHGGRDPNKQQCYEILDAIKADLYNGGKDFIPHGVQPRVALVSVG